MNKKVISIAFYLTIIFAQVSAYRINRKMNHNNMFGCHKIEDKNNLKILSPRLKNINTEKWVSENGLNIMLISDPEASQSAIAYITRVGSGDDPDGHNGCAHFIEHMVAGRSNEKFQGGVEEFIVGQGGIYNASTYIDKTDYMFSVPHHIFEEAIDRFSSMLCMPKFVDDEGKVEINAIDEESKIAKKHDGHLLWSGIMSSFNPNHPASHYYAGDKETLKNANSEFLKSWYEKHYTSDDACFVCMSKLAMNEIREIVLPKIAEVPKRESWKRNTLPKAITESKYKFVQTVSGSNVLTVCWDIGTSGEANTQYPEFVIAQLLNMSTEDSLYDLLKKDGLCEKIESEVCNMTKNMPTLFITEITLTEKGVKNWKRVLSEVIGAIEKISKEQDLSAFIDHLNICRKISYTYSNRSKPFEKIENTITQMVGESLSTYPQKSIELGQNISTQTINAAAKLLLKNPKIVVIGSDFDLFKASDDGIPKPNTKEDLPKHEIWEYSQLEFETSELPASLLSERIVFPLGCRFLPKTIPSPTIDDPSSDFSINTQKHSSTTFKNMFFVEDKLFGIPKTILKIKVLPKILCQNDPKSHFLAEVCCKIVDKKHDNLKSEASLGLNSFCAAYKGVHNITIFVEAWDKCLTNLMRSIFENMASNDIIDQETFDRVLETIKNDIVAIEQEQPYAKAVRLLREELNVCEISLEDRKKLLEEITFEEVLSTWNKIKYESRVDVCIFGQLNMIQKDEIANIVQSVFHSKINEDLKEVSHPGLEVGTLEKVIPSHMIGHGVVLAFDCGHSSEPKNFVKTWILSKGLFPIVSELREKEGLAYVVTSIMREINQRVVLIFLIQSKTCHNKIIREKYEKIVETTLSQMGNGKYFGEEKLQSLQKSCKDFLSSPSESPKSFFGDVYDIAFSRNEKWNFKQEAIDATNFSKEEFFTFCKDVLQNNSKRIFVAIEGELEETKTDLDS